MKYAAPIAFACLAALPATAEEGRQLGAHEHGVGALNIAFEGSSVALEFHAPGADIVGFEYEAETAEDRAKIDAAVATLARPLDLFVLPEAAACQVVEARASLESEEEHDDHGHGDHGHDDHGHDDHGHDQAEAEESHTEFEAQYLLTCASPEAITSITFAYFDVFPNARELEIQMISESGGAAFEVERDEPVLDLKGVL